MDESFRDFSPLENSSKREKYLQLFCPRAYIDRGKHNLHLQCSKILLIVYIHHSFTKYCEHFLLYEHFVIYHGGSNLASSFRLIKFSRINKNASA